LGERLEAKMTENRNVWVFIEQEDNRIADVSLELLGKAHELSHLLQDSGSSGSQVWAILCGHQVAELPRQLIEYGADHVLVAEHPELELYRTLPYSRVVIEQVRKWQPYIFLFGATPLGRDLAPRVASALQAGLTADCTDLQIGDYTSRKDQIVYKDLLLQIRPAFGGNLIATIVNPLTRPQMATVREGVMHKLEPDPQRVRTVELITPQFQPGDFALEVLGRQMREATVKLKDAPVIVAGGGGVGSQAEFDLIRELANLLGGEVGASRAAVDAGFISREHQVGQTGTTVRPRLYIAAGISGAIQHRAGMDQSNKIIAINTDPNAPIFQVAQYKIVGDLNEVLPMLIKALREKSR